MYTIEQIKELQHLLKEGISNLIEIQQIATKSDLDISGLDLTGSPSQQWFNLLIHAKDLAGKDYIQKLVENAWDGSQRNKYLLQAKRYVSKIVIQEKIAKTNKWILVISALVLIGFIIYPTFFVFPELTKLKKQHVEELKEIKTDYLTKLSSLEKQYEKALEDLEDNHKRALDRINSYEKDTVKKTSEATAKAIKAQEDSAIAQNKAFKAQEEASNANQKAKEIFEGLKNAEILLKAVKDLSSSIELVVKELVLNEEFQSKIRNLLAIPTGTIISFYGSENQISEGFLLCNGASIDSIKYKGLRDFLEEANCLEESNNFFKLPDLRGVFLRGVDLNKGFDSGRLLGSAQEDSFQTHSHKTSEQSTNLEEGKHGHSTYRTKDPRDKLNGSAKPAILLADLVERTDLPDLAPFTSNHTHHFTPNIGIPANFGKIVIKHCAEETRPINVAVNFIIKY